MNGIIQRSSRAFQITSMAILIVIAGLCLMPLLMILSGSITSEEEIYRSGFKLIPGEISLAAYRELFRWPETILRAYGVTILTTLCGTALGLFFMSMTGYVISRKEFKYRNGIAFMIYFTTLFQGGLIPWYILIVKYLKLKDHLIVLILPYLILPFLAILMKNFMKGIPEEISESAKMDGANHFTIYSRLILPLAKPGLATIGLFLALHYWNDWLLSSLYIKSSEKFSLQFFLYNIIKQEEFLRSDIAGQAGSAGDSMMPSESLKMATAIVVTGPIVFLYPYVQRFFISGLTLGAVKG